LEKIWKLSIEEVLEKLKVDLEKGLSKEEAENRLKIYGFNELPEKNQNQFLQEFIIR